MGGAVGLLFLAIVLRLIRRIRGTGSADDDAGDDGPPSPDDPAGEAAPTPEPEPAAAPTR